MVNNGSCYAGERIRLQLYLSPCRSPRTMFLPRLLPSSTSH
jgi:hypothetical protein